ncbi:hypothetical protein WJX73_003355 [Symbiochloris irregularis]|uniref:Impact N-terminal domain-containing protein n=1 Tax=Symbiochloris irregularis TaxID=706552 RepID=A0AAW1PWW5_9CHLO
MLCSGRTLLCSTALRGTQHPAVRVLGCRPYSTASAADGSGHDSLAAAVSHTLEVKKSKFVASAWPVTDSSQALELLAKHKDDAASHNCWAYKCDQDFRCSDDGEPSGTAGRPILGAIEGEELDMVMVVVTRFFGGVKLGAGGLVRAYGRAARECLRQGDRVHIAATAEMSAEVPCEHMGAVFVLLEQHGIQRLGEQYRFC